MPSSQYYVQKIAQITAQSEATIGTLIDQGEAMEKERDEWKKKAEDYEKQIQEQDIEIAELKGQLILRNGHDLSEDTRT